MSEVPELEVRGVHYSYPGPVKALQGVSLRIPPGSFTALIGQNGSGKTTLARQLNGLQRPTQGQVLLNGEDTVDRSVSELARSVGYCFQNPDHQIFRTSTRDEISFGPVNLGLEVDEVEQRVDQELARFGLEELAERPPATLSYGQRRLVSLAAVFAMRTPVLVLDEPTLGLDRRHIDVLIDAIHQRHNEGASVLLITHDMGLVAAHAPRAALLHEGRLLTVGSAHEVLTDPELLAESGLAAPPIVQVTQRLRSLGHELPTVTTPEGLCHSLKARLGAGDP
ncbi:MAG: ABC transporter ATP-binding protein [Anaerolineales bacterium]|nr:ABC transporter ATP-binding protein [Anaerolineales bacterium]